MNTTMTPFLGMLAGAVPLLLVYMVGIVLAVVWWGRWPQVCGLVFAGCAILLVIGIVHPLIQSSIITNRTGSAASMGQTLAMISMIATVFRAVGFGLLIWAAFAGRPVPIAQLSAFETLPPRS